MRTKGATSTVNVKLTKLTKILAKHVYIPVGRQFAEMHGLLDEKAQPLCPSIADIEASTVGQLKSTLELIRKSLKQRRFRPLNKK